MWTPPKPPGNSPHVVPANPIPLTPAPTFGHLWAAAMATAGGATPADPASDYTANIPLDPGEFSARETEYPLAIDIGSYGKKKLICKTLHHSGRSVYVVTLNGEVVTTTAFVNDAVNHYNAIQGGT